MPRKLWPIWLWTILLLIGFPIINFVYWWEVLISGILPPDGDSVAIPMFEGLLATIVLSPSLLLITWLALRKYDPDTCILVWRRDRPLRTLIASGLCAAGCYLLLADAVILLMHIAPWYEYMIACYFFLWLPWLFWLRAAFINQKQKNKMTHRPNEKGRTPFGPAL